MFTGIIEEVGKIVRSQPEGSGSRLIVFAPKLTAEVDVNDSVAINGCCQTVIEKSSTTFTVQAVEETLKKTTLGELKDGARVNLELAMKLNHRLGGHLVLGHVDGVGVVSSVEKREGSWLYSIEVPSEFLRYLIPVGSVAVDGVSLTVAKIQGNRIGVSIIPHTYENTNFKHLSPGNRVNLEFDLIGKYIERLIMSSPQEKKLTASTLKEWGYG